MPLRYLLGTDVLSSLIREPGGHSASRLMRAGAGAVCTSHRGPDAPADRHYEEIRERLTRQGTSIGPNDLWIASHARSRDLCIVTGNLREFTRIPALKVESWLAAGV